VSQDGVSVEGSRRIWIPADSLRTVEMSRLNGMSRVIKIVHEGGTFFASVVRWSVGGYFAVGDHSGTRVLHDRLAGLLR
jgi:hypothetical protein